MKLLSKEEYIKALHDREDKCIKEYKELHGEAPEDCWQEIADEGDFTPEEIVGNYLENYEDYLGVWWDNMVGSLIRWGNLSAESDLEVTRILILFDFYNNKQKKA